MQRPADPTRAPLGVERAGGAERARVEGQHGIERRAGVVERGDPF